MKVTVVPAQVTTVEDRIAGPLGISQLILLVAPVFIDSALYVCLLPFFHYAVYKVVLMATVLAVSSLLAIRIKGKLVLFWLTVLLRYGLRPHYYVFNKQSLHGRARYEDVSADDQTDAPKKTPRVVRRPLPLSIAEIIATKDLLDMPAANVSFITKKGGLYVHITEAKPES